MKFRKAAPVGYSCSVAFLTRSRGCTLEEIRTPVYEVLPNAQAVMTLRRVRKLGLCAAALRIGVSAVDLSGLERGRLVPENSADWSRVIERLGCDD